MKFKKLFAGLVSLAAALFAVCAITVCAGAETYVSGDYKYSILDDGTVEITGYTGSATELEIPSTLDGKSVTSIAGWAFGGCSSLTSISVPDGVTDIKGYAFRDCSSLVSINLSKSVVVMGYSGTNMPWTCTFSGCASLTSINVDNNNKVYSSQDGVLFNKNKTRIMLCPAGKKGKYTIPDGVTSVGVNAFDDCSGLTSIDIPDGVTSIEFEAFFGCSSLTSVDIPDGVTSIGAMAFYGCSSLKSIKIPESVTEIGDPGEGRAFFGCTSLTSIKIPSKVTEIYYETFSECSSLASINIPDSVTSIGTYAFSGTPFLDNQTTTVKYAGKWAVDCDEDAVTAEIKSGTVGIAGNAFRNCTSLASINIPDGVTSIGDSAFENCSSLKSINIPNGVTSIGRYVFDDCTSLKSINIPDSVTSIGYSAFDNCSSLNSINIPDSVTSIESMAFYNCSSLTSVNIGDGTTSISYSAFWGCSSLTSITVDDNNAYYSSKDGVLFNKGKTQIILCPEGKKGKYTIPDSVTSIESYTFWGCSSLTSINIPDSVTSIGQSAFSGCSSLTSVDIPDGVTSIGDEAFRDCSSLTSIDIPGSVTSIGDYAFYNCSSLTSIDIPDGVMSIGDYAFRDCSSLASIKIPDSVTSIGGNVFYNTPFLNNQTTTVKYAGKLAVDCDANAITAEIKSGTVGIADYAFSWCSSLASIKIPDGVTSIGDSTFYNCSSLTSITIPDGVTSIGDSTFYNCSSLKSINIPDSVTSIGYSAFDNCSSLNSINIPDSVTSIGESAFYNCSSLTSINIPDGVTSIGSDVFYNTPFLKYMTGTVKYAGKWVIGCDRYATAVTIKSGTVGILGGAFQYCRDLTSVSIPDGVKSIGDLAFSGCSSLTSINIPDGVTSIGDWAFRDCSSLTSIDIPGSVTSIGDRTFYNCSSLTSINIPDSVTSIGSDVFYYTPFLDNQTDTVKYAGKWVIGCDRYATAMTIKSGTIGIADYAFYYCRDLTSVTIPDSVTSIGGYAFSGCSSLTSITIPESVTSIGSSAFSRCSSLTSIAIPESVTSIGSSAFYDCVKLKDVYYTGSKAQWDKIAIGESNDHLLGANIHCLDLGISGLKLKARAADALRLTWTKNTSADGYIIEMQSGSSWTRVGKITSNATVEFKKSGLKAGTAYTFRVKAYKMVGNTAIYSGYTTISARTNPSATTGLKLKARAADALRLTWTKNTSADGYIIEMKSGNSWVRVGKITSNSTVEFKKSGLKAGTAYTFRVKAYKMSGKTALYGAAKTISVRTNPSAVSGLKLKARAADALRLTWTKNTSADGYIIEMQSGNSWTRVGKITSNSTVEFKKSGLKAGTAYTFRVKAYKMSGKTALYGTAKTISVRTNPSTVSGLKLKASAKDAIRLSWTKNTSADGYIIEMKSGNTWTRVGKFTSNATVEFKKSGLKAGTAYTFRVKAYKMSGKTALYGAAKTITVKTK